MQALNANAGNDVQFQTAIGQFNEKLKVSEEKYAEKVRDQQQA